MKIWFVFNCLIIATVFRVANGTSCCRGQHDEGCYGNGLCDSECCNCQEGCNEYLRLSKCGWKTKAECALKVGQCALTCYDNGVTSSQCVSCFGGVYTKCVACLPGSLTADQVVNDTQSLIEVSSDKGKCGPMAWIECAVVVTGCAVSCIDPLDPLCIACLGPMYHKCAKCIHHKKTEVELLQNNTEVILQNYRNDFETTCQKSATQIWAQPENCCRGVHDKGCYGIGRCDGNCCNCDGGCNRYMMLSKCSLSDKIKCAAKVALCGKTCLKEGVKSASCIKCLGKVYKKCIGCIKGVEESLSGDQIVVDSTEMVVAKLGCSAIKWAKCGARLAICAASCVEPLDPLCAICMGKLFAKCKSCMSKHMDLQRLRMSTHEMVKERFSDFNGICKRETLVAGNCCKARHEDVCYGNGLCDGDCCNCQDGCNEYLVLSKCGWKQKLKCSVTVAKCASTCLKNGVISSQCKRCFGKLYKSCVQCLPTGLGAAAIVRGNQKMMEIRLGCNILECAVKIATCAAQCKNPISFGCVSCLGPAYDECKSCFFGDVNVMLHKNNTEELAKKHFKSSKSASFMIVPSQFMMGLFYLTAMSVYFIF